MDKIKTIKRGQVLVSAGEYGPVWRITEGVFRLERMGYDGLSLVQLGLPGDLLGVEALCAEPYAYTITAITTTQCELHYEGSCAIDENLLDAANICENEQVHIWNINNGERFITYAIKGERGSGMISVNGSAARRASVGDLLIIASFAQVHETEVAKHEPQLVFVDEHNQQVGLRHHVPTQAAPGHGTDEC